MKRTMPWLSFAIVLVTSVAAQADMIVVAQRHFADRASIVGWLYQRGGGQRVHVSIGSINGSSPPGWKIDLECQDEWDLIKVEQVTKSIVEYINKNNNIDLNVMLSAAGLTGCKYFF